MTTRACPRAHAHAQPRRRAPRHARGDHGAPKVGIKAAYMWCPKQNMARELRARAYAGEQGARARGRGCAKANSNTHAHRNVGRDRRGTSRAPRRAGTAARHVTTRESNERERRARTRHGSARVRRREGGTQTAHAARARPHPHPPATARSPLTTPTPAPPPHPRVPSLGPSCGAGAARAGQLPPRGSGHVRVDGTFRKAGRLE